jgi:hypothetical protein
MLSECEICERVWFPFFLLVRQGPVLRRTGLPWQACGTVCRLPAVGLKLSSPDGAGVDASAAAGGCLVRVVGCTG